MMAISRPSATVSVQGRQVGDELVDLRLGQAEVRHAAVLAVDGQLGRVDVHRYERRRVAEPRRELRRVEALGRRALEVGRVEATGSCRSAVSLGPAGRASAGRSWRRRTCVAAHQVGEVRARPRDELRRRPARRSAGPRRPSARSPGGSREHWLLNMRLARPWRGPSVGGGRRLVCWFATQASKSSGESATTRMRMLAWDRPQNSVHWPQYSPGCVGLEVPAAARGRGRRRACR